MYDAAFPVRARRDRTKSVIIITHRIRELLLLCLSYNIYVAVKEKVKRWITEMMLACVIIFFVDFL